MPKKTVAKKKIAAPKKKAGSSLIERSAQAAMLRNKRKGEDALAMIDRRVEQIAEAFYDIALQLQILLRKEIYVALGAKSFDEVVETRTRLSRSTAFALVRIPEHLSREMAIKLGSDKSKALIELTEATAVSDSAEHLARSDAKVGGKTVSEQTGEGLREAARGARVRSNKKKGARPEEAAARTAANALEGRLEKKLKVELTVVPQRQTEGWFLRVTIPVAAAARL